MATFLSRQRSGGKRAQPSAAGVDGGDGAAAASRQPVPFLAKRGGHNELYCTLPPGCVSWGKNICLDIVISSKPSKPFLPRTLRAAPVAQAAPVGKSKFVGCLPHTCDLLVRSLAPSCQHRRVQPTMPLSRGDSVINCKEHDLGRNRQASVLRQWGYRGHYR